MIVLIINWKNWKRLLNIAFATASHKYGKVVWLISAILLLLTLIIIIIIIITIIISIPQLPQAKKTAIQNKCSAKEMAIERYFRLAE